MTVLDLHCLLPPSTPYRILLQSSLTSPPHLASPPPHTYARPSLNSEVLSKFPGLKVVDNPQQKQYPMPLTATAQYDVEVSACLRACVRAS